MKRRERERGAEKQRREWILRWQPMPPNLYASVYLLTGYFPLIPPLLPVYAGNPVRIGARAISSYLALSDWLPWWLGLIKNISPLYFSFDFPKHRWCAWGPLSEIILIN